MHNLKKFNGTYKGMIGECMFKLTRDKTILMKCFNKNKYLTIFSKHFTIPQKEFIQRNWHSLDAIEISYNKGKEIKLFEIKTKNEYRKKLGFKLKITQSTANLYEYAKKIWFKVIVATVHMHNNWNYSITLTDFNLLHYCIDKPKVYDKN